MIAEYMPARYAVHIEETPAYLFVLPDELMEAKQQAEFAMQGPVILVSYQRSPALLVDDLFMHRFEFVKADES